MVAGMDHTSTFPLGDAKLSSAFSPVAKYLKSDAAQERGPPASTPFKPAFVGGASTPRRDAAPAKPMPPKHRRVPGLQQRDS